MKRKITKLMAALALLAFLAIPMGMRGQSDYSSDYTGNITLSTEGGANASACIINISNVDYNGIKAGTGSKAGAVMITVPSGTKYLHLHAAAWNNTTCFLTVTPEGYSDVIALTANSGISNNSPFTFNGNANTSDYYKVITFSSALTSDTDLTFTATGGKRFVIWGVTSEEEGSNPPTPTCATPTFSPAAGTYTEAQTVSISCAIEGATIYYTTNGDDPATSSTVYADPINVSSNMTIKAMAAKSGFNNSAVATAEYAFITFDHAGTLEDPYTVADARAAIDANAGTQGIYATGIVSAIPTAYNSNYGNITFNLVDEEGDEVFLQAYRCAGDEAANVAIGDVAVVYGNLTYYAASQTYEFAQGCQLVSLTHPVNTDPFITITPDNFELDANSHMAEVLTRIAYQNIAIVPGSGNESFDVQYYDAEGQETEHTWCVVGAYAVSGSEEEFDLGIFAFLNDGTEPRTVYFKLYGLDAEGNEVYSNLVTITQAAPVIDYATLPFVWEGGPKADFLALNGVTAHGLGSDYAAGNSPYLIKFDDTGDYIQVKTDSQPGKVTIGVKMIGGANTSTITIQGSADGETFTNIEELTISGEQNDVLTLETINVFGENDRYVRMLFTKGSNVGVGPITVEKGNAPSIIVTPATINLEAAGQGVPFQMTQMNVTYSNLEIESWNDFAVQFYDAEGLEQTQPNWIMNNPAGVSGGNDSGYLIALIIADNQGPARSAYFRVYALGEEDYVYSNLVTINQAGVAQQYTLTVEPFENLEIFTFIDDELTEPMEGAGSIQVTEGTSVMLSVSAVEGYVLETLMVNGVDHVNDIADDFTYTFEMPAENVTISATAVEDVPPTPGEWVMTRLDDLTEDDVFVIVGVYDADESSFAMPNSNGTSSAPSAVAVTMVGNTLSGDIAENLQWNLSIGEEGYTFYPNGNTEAWLYCTSTNNGVRVGTNENNVFTMTPEGYLFNNATERYIGIYNSQDWRCYTTINNNIKNQTFAFYKRVDESDIVTYTLDIEGYGDSDGGYYLIASPVSMNRPTFENGFITEAYDLYYFDQAQNGEEWRNYKAKHFNIAAGKGYLYASQENTTLTFTGVPYEGDGKVALDYVEGVNLTGWNLIGNPYDQDYDIIIGNESGYSETNFYVMNEDGDDFELAERSFVHPMEGVLVEATAVGQFAYFTNEIGPWGGDPFEMLNIRVSDENGKGDFARIRFGEGNNFEKFMLNPENTKIYFPVDNEEYAVVYAENMGEMPLNFSAAADGNYTLTFTVENMEMDYLHLIDNMTGMDIDLLQTAAYSFEATVDDNAARFTLVFANLTGIEENSAEQFAIFSNGNLIVNNEGEATLQVIDVAGRIVKSESVNGCANVNVNAAPGVYMLRLVNGDNVKTQKVVVE